MKKTGEADSEFVSVGSTPAAAVRLLLPALSGGPVLGVGRGTMRRAVIVLEGQGSGLFRGSLRYEADRLGLVARIRGRGKS